MNKWIIDTQSLFFKTTGKQLTVYWVKRKEHSEFGKTSWCLGSTIWLRYKRDFCHEVAHAFDFTIGGEAVEKLFGFNRVREACKKFCHIVPCLTTSEECDYTMYDEEDFADIVEGFVKKWLLNNGIDVRQTR